MAGSLSLSSSLTLALAPRVSGSGSAPVQQQTFNGATATFSSARQGGTFADGSPWALTGGTITSLTPAYIASGTGTFAIAPGDTVLASGATIVGTGVTLRKINGAEINPGNRSYTSGSTALNKTGPLQQGFDGLGDRQGMIYTASRNVDPAATGSGIDISAEKTVLKSIVTGHTIETDSAASHDIKGVIDRYAPFTFLNTAPASDAYRPGIARTSKAIFYKRSDIDLTVLPTGLSWPGGAYGSLPDIAAITAQFSDPYWLSVTKNSGQGRVITCVGGSGTQPNYGRDIAHIVGKALLCLCMSDYTNAQKLALIDKLVPFALDVAARVEEGGIFPTNGGGDSWRKAVVVVVARLMRNSPNYSYLAGYASNIVAFTEDNQINVAGDALLGMIPAVTVNSIVSGGTGYTNNDTVTLSAADEGAPITFTATVVSGVITALTLLDQGYHWKTYATPTAVPLTGGTGSGATVDIRPRDRYAPFMRGEADWGESTISQARPGANYNAFYRDINSGPTMGAILACRLINGAQTLWNSPGTFYYYDRYWNVNKGASRDDNNSISVIAGAMMDAYRGARYAGVAPSKTALKAEGSFVWVETDQLLDELTLPATSDFAVTVGGVAATVNYVRIFGSKIGLRLATPLTSGATAVTIAYTQGSTKAKNIDGQFLPSFASGAATNRTGALPTPVTTMAMCDNNNSAYLNLNGFGPDTSVDRALIAIKFKLDSLVVGAPIWYRNNNSRLWLNSSTQLRLQIGSSSILQQNINGVTTGTCVAIYAIDRSGTPSSKAYLSINGGAWITAGAPAGITAGTWNFSILLNGNIGILSDCTDPTGAVPATSITDGGIEWFIMDYGLAANGFTLPDITVQAYRDALTTMNLNNTNAQIATFSGGAPKLFFMGNTAEFNDTDVGSINRGSLQGKSFIPDVTGFS